MIDKEKLKALAEATKGWDNLTECWPAGESDPDWEVGAIGEDGDTYPVLTINTDQYDAEHDAAKLAQYYAAANAKTILALIAENESLRKDAERLDWLDGQYTHIVEGQSAADPEGEVVTYRWSVEEPASSVREAIDYARVRPKP